MIGYNIYFVLNTPDEYSKIIQEYWEIDNNDFCNKPTKICEKYNIGIKKLTEIVKTYSLCTIVHNYCSDCGIPIKEDVYSQTEFKEKKRQDKKRCDKCEITFFNLLEEKRFVQEKIEQEKIKEIFAEAIQEKRWLNLSSEEFKILREIVRLKNKSLIYKEIFNSNPYDKAIWKIINSIEKKGLLFIKREPYPYRGVIKFIFPEQLEKILEMTNNENLNNLKLILSKNTNKKQTNQPDYMGTFILKRPVNLKSGIKYIYGGWINPDGSMKLNILPQDDISQVVEHIYIDEDPINVQNILNDFFFNINELDEIREKYDDENNDWLNL